MIGGSTSYRGTTFSERMATAPCLTEDPEMGYPATDGKRGKSHAEREAQAKTVCRRCPFELRQECLGVAMKAEGTTGASGRHGVFGGLDPQERAALARHRNGEVTACGDKAGTHTGRQRHRSAGETPCAPCRAAFAEYIRDWRARDRVTP